MALSEAAHTTNTFIATSVIAALTLRRSAALSAALDWKPLAALGRWSYSIYLLHVPLGVLVARLRPETLLQHPIRHPLMDALRIGWMAALSAPHYRWVEQTWIRRSRGQRLLLSESAHS